MTKKAFSFIPQYSFRNVIDIKPEFLLRLGIEFLILDLDNTIAAYDEKILSDDVSQWIVDVKNSGIELFIISNSTRFKRVDSFARAVGTGYIMKAGKPSPKNVFFAMEKSGFKSDVTALAGDQILTDTLAANRAGVVSIIVRPKRFTNPILTLRYLLEKPFRARCKNKGDHHV